jgi:hypothetical protein
VLIARGFSPSFVLKDGRTMRPPRGSAILQDETGDALQPNIVLVMPFTRTRRPLPDAPPEVRRHFGRGHEVLKGTVVLPPITRGWRRLGEVREAYYTRRGEHAGHYEHTFGAWRMFRGHGALPVLYQRSGALKLELAPGSSWDWAGVRG